MRPVSDAFLRSLRGSHTMVSRARVVDTFQTGTDPDGTEIEITEGSVTCDGTADIRSTLDLSTDGTSMWPRRVSDPLAPYGNEVFVERGIQYGNGTTEWVSLGYHRIETPEQDQPGDGPIRVTCYDRMAGLIDGRLLAPVQFPASTTYGAVVVQLVTDIYPDATIEWDDDTDDDTLGRAVLCEEDRHGFLRDMVRALGKIWYWDHRGILVLATPADPGDPVFDVTAGEDGVLVTSARHITRTGVYNAVVANGEGTDTALPGRGVAIDNNPASATYFYGRFGKVPRFYSSPFITTDAQARAAAETMLRLSLGLPYKADFTAVPNPALEPYDPVRVRHAVTESVETHVLERVTTPLTHNDAMTAGTKEQTTILIGAM